jgi:hypothetical protein
MLNESERYQDAANGLNSHYYNSKDYHGLSFQPCDAWVECIERGIFINSDAGLKVA